MTHFIQLKITAVVVGKTLWIPNKYFRFQSMNVIYYTVTIQVSVSARFTPPLKYLDLFNTKSKRFSSIVTSYWAFSFYRYLRESWNPIQKILISFTSSRLNIGIANPFLIATCFLTHVIHDFAIEYFLFTSLNMLCK